MFGTNINLWWGGPIKGLGGALAPPSPKIFPQNKKKKSEKKKIKIKILLLNFLFF